MVENSVLRKLLQDYEQKRLFAEQEYYDKKEALLSSNEDLRKIEDELNKLSIEKMKTILSSKDETLLENINSRINDLKLKKENLLKELYIDLTIKYDCNICSDTGYIKKNNTSSMCNCLKQKLFDIEYNKSNIGNIEKENFETFNLNLYSDVADFGKYGINISPKENMKIIKNICLSFINNFDNPEEKNLLFTGNTGLGKTFLCNCIANEILKQNKTVLYQTAPVMIDAIIDYRFAKTNSSINLIDNLLNVDLLIIDDLGTEAINSMKLSELFTIINSRVLNQNHKITKTIISTNLNLNNLFAIYNERIGSRFVGYYNICKFVGDDIRFKK